MFHYLQWRLTFGRWKVASLVLPTEVGILVSSQFTSCTLEVEVLSCVLHIITIISTAIKKNPEQ